MSQRFSRSFASQHNGSASSVSSLMGEGDKRMHRYECLDCRAAFAYRPLQAAPPSLADGRRSPSPDPHRRPRGGEGEGSDGGGSDRRSQAENRV